MLISAAPTDPADQFAQTLAAYERRIADLERVLGRYRGGAGAPAGTGVNGQEYWDSTNLRLYRSDGTGWIVMYEPRQTYTPSASWTVGNGVWTAGFKRSNGLCTFDASFVFGTTSATAGDMTVGLPKASIAQPAGSLGCSFSQSGVGVFPAVSAALAAAATTALVRGINTAGTYALYAASSATVPFTWANLATVNVSGTYPMNTPYL